LQGRLLPPWRHGSAHWERTFPSPGISEGISDQNKTEIAI
jgi:hypothetical protein